VTPPTIPAPSSATERRPSLDAGVVAGRGRTRRHGGWDAVSRFDPERQVDLARRWAAARAALDLLDGAHLAPRERSGGPSSERGTGPDPSAPRRRARLESIVRDGRSARDELVCANLGLVHRFALPRRGYAERETAVSGGLIGLLEAVDRFDPARGYRFATYAVAWIRKRTDEEVARDRPVRLPDRQVRVGSRVESARQRLASEGRGEVDDAELAAEAGVSERELATWRSSAGMRAAPCGLEDAGQGALGEPGFEEALVEQAAADAAAAALERALAQLGEDQRRALVLRFGFDGQGPRSLREAARALGCSHDRVDSLEKAALRALRCLLEGELDRSWS
jgi:RNA polymerase primary sigma factor